MANIIPSTESTVNTLIPNVKFALGPLIIKKKTTLIITVNIDNSPNIFFVFSFKIDPPSILKQFMLVKQTLSAES